MQKMQDMQEKMPKLSSLAEDYGIPGFSKQDTEGET